MTNLTSMLQAVRQAADLCRRIQQRHFVHSEKGANDPVTIADYGVQVILHRALSRAYPDDGILSEEQANQFMTVLDDAQRAEITALLREVLDEPVTPDDIARWLDHGSGRQTERMWVVDPIDGTKGFINMRHYTIAVGVLRDNEPVEAILGCPGYDSPDGQGMLFYTQDGIPLAEPMSGGAAHRITVSNRVDTASSLVVESVVREHSDFEQMRRIHALLGIPDANVRQIDSQEKYARVAAGDADLYMRLPRATGDNRISIWDHAPGTALLRAAGGIVTDLDGSKLDFSRGRELSANSGIVVTNGHIHEAVIRAIQTVRGEA